MLVSNMRDSFDKYMAVDRNVCVIIGAEEENGQFLSTLRRICPSSALRFQLLSRSSIQIG